ncbi:DUF3080 domain-containing protein [Photobacterium japonica]|uniref:DUF3080 domain-containing protein n=1 Tax=Photobacterium japonica TaxID=2910235 RepID=UPI003D120405
MRLPYFQRLNLQPFTLRIIDNGRLMLCGLAITLLAGCDRHSADAQFDTYQARLANVLDVSAQSPDNIETVPFPDTRDLMLPVEDIRINLLDAYELRQCGLFNLIAERNSILGKVQDKTRQLRYELLFLHGLQHCLTVLPDDTDLYATLLDYQTKKQQQFPISLWNMLTTGKEWRQQFTLHYQAFTPQQLYGFNASLAAFSYAQHLATHIAAHNSISEKQANRVLFHQEQLHPYHYFGQLAYSIEHATLWLNTITTLLTNHEAAILCGENRNQQKATYLSNVFYKHFVSTLQPYLAELDSQYQQIQPFLLILLRPPRTIDAPSLSRYYQYYIAGEQHQAFRDATLAHVDFWKRTFKRCNIRVGIR